MEQQFDIDLNTVDERTLSEDEQEELTYYRDRAARMHIEVQTGEI